MRGRFTGYGGLIFLQFFNTRASSRNAQSLFLFPIVFGINLVSSLDYSFGKLGILEFCGKTRLTFGVRSASVLRQRSGLTPIMPSGRRRRQGSPDREGDADSSPLNHLIMQLVESRHDQMTQLLTTLVAPLQGQLSRSYKTAHVYASTDVPHLIDLLATPTPDAPEDALVATRAQLRRQERDASLRYTRQLEDDARTHSLINHSDAETDVSSSLTAVSPPPASTPDDVDTPELMPLDQGHDDVDESDSLVFSFDDDIFCSTWFFSYSFVKE